MPFAAFDDPGLGVAAGGSPLLGAPAARTLRALFDLLHRPANAIRTAGARWAGLLVVAINGKYSYVPDNPDVRARLRKGADQYTAASSYS